MSNQEARRLVAEGLQRRKEQKRAAEREAKLEHYEQEQFLHIHRNCQDARKERAAELANQDTARMRAAQRAEKEQKRIREQQREEMAINAVKNYVLLCLITLCSSAIAILPLWTAVALIAGGASFPAAYIYRLYNPF